MIDVTFVPALDATAEWASQLLDPEELSRWSRLHAPGRPLFLAAHLGARMLVARRMAWATDPPSPGPDLHDFGWSVGPTGKPSLTFRDGRPQPLHISVAHGGGLAVAAACDHGPIGVDVEHVDGGRALLPIARRFFSTDEHDTLTRCGADERTALFHQWWTRKEAVLKCTGDGLRGGLTVRVDGQADADGWRAVAVPGRAAPVFVRDLRTPDASVMGAVAIEGQPAVVQSVFAWLDSTSPVG